MQPPGIVSAGAAKAGPDAADAQPLDLLRKAEQRHEQQTRNGSKAGSAAPAENPRADPPEPCSMIPPAETGRDAEPEAAE